CVKPRYSNYGWFFDFW
nr:immunoglobulin heavy chain junction region [Macaca mulatta]